MDNTTSRLRSEVALFSNFPPLLGDDVGGGSIFWMTEEFVEEFWFTKIFLDVLFELMDGCLLTNRRCFEFKFLESADTESKFGSLLLVSCFS